MGGDEIQSITFTFELSTPTFLRGYNKKAEFRMSSFVGVLRFWWRACMWAKVGSSGELYKSETAIFGRTKQQSKLNFVLVDDNISTKELTDNDPILKNNGLKYLSYGVFDESEGGDYIVAGSTSRIRIYYHSLKEEQLNSLLDALRALHFFGGLGSNSRDGFGSFNITSEIELSNKELNVILPSDLKALKSEIRIFLDKYSKGEPPYSALSETNRVFISRWNKNSEAILRNYGEKFQKYRVGLQHSFKDDTLAVKNIIDSTNAKSDLPTRIIFGLPHNYFFKKIEGQKPMRYDKVSFGIKDRRRASPLFFKVVKFGGGYTGVALILESQFLPKGASIEVILSKEKGGSHPPIYSDPDPPFSYDPIYTLFQDELKWEEI